MRIGQLKKIRCGRMDTNAIISLYRHMSKNGKLNLRLHLGTEEENTSFCYRRKKQS